MENRRDELVAQIADLPVVPVEPGGCNAALDYVPVTAVREQIRPAVHVERQLCKITLKQENDNIHKRKRDERSYLPVKCF
jgi:hypothetical protein